VWFRKKRVGGGRGDHSINHIPLPAALAGNDGGKSLQQILFGTEAERRSAEDGSATDRTLVTDRQAAQQHAGVAPFGLIDLVEFESTGGNTLRGRYYRPAQQTRVKTVILCSGSGGSSEEYMLDVARAYAAHGAPVLALNYRGFGSSGSNDHRGYAKGGSPTESGLYNDAYYMYMHLIEKRACIPPNIIVHGFSLGGPIATSLVKTLAKEGTQVGGLVLHSPMPSAPEAANEDGEDDVNEAVTKWALGTFDTRKKLTTIHEKFPSTKVRVIGGTQADGDQLDPRRVIPQTGRSLLQDIRALGFANLQVAHGAGDHTNVAAHMAAAATVLTTSFL
jgi:pimeloyl-ACP methyl ester carboxylesterase